MHGQPLVLTEDIAPIKRVGYLVPTTYCWMGCAFCSISQPLPNVPLSLAPDGLSLEKIHDVDFSAIDILKIRGGLSIKEPFDYWIHLLRAIRSRVPAPIYAFSAMEIWQFHVREHRSLRELLHLLLWAGADFLGPGGSEVLLTDPRYAASSYRLTLEEWHSVIEAAHAVGLKSTLASIVYADMPMATTREYIAKISAQAVDHIEVKPFRSEGTNWSIRESPHVMDLGRHVALLKDALLHTPIYVKVSPKASHDSLQILSSHGAAAFLIPCWEVTP